MEEKATRKLVRSKKRKRKQREKRKGSKGRRERKERKKNIFLRSFQNKISIR